MVADPGFFPAGNKRQKQRIQGLTPELLHQGGCYLCPLNCQEDFHLDTPHMPPSGSTTPIVYMLGEAPGEHEDKQGVPFIGPAGQYLRERLPNGWTRKLRWSNVVRTRPKDNDTPSARAIECCRPSIIADIEASKPRAIFGFGNVPLQWAIKRNGILQWCGRRIPVQIGSHACWFFPLLHPAAILHLQRAAHDPSLRRQHEEARFIFDLNLRQAFAAVQAGLPRPVPHTRAMVTEDIELLYSIDDIDAALHTLASGHGVVGIDLETNGIRPYETGAQILSVALSGPDLTVAFPIQHRDYPRSERDVATIADMLRDWLVNARCRKAQFTAFEMEWLAHWLGREVLWSAWADAQGQAYLLDARQGTLSLEFLCLQHFGIDVKAIDNLDRTRLAETDLNAVLRYNGLDARCHRLLYLRQARLIREAGMTEVWQHHNRRIAAIVATQLNGVPINPDTVATLVETYRDKQLQIEADIQALPLAVEFHSSTGKPLRPSANADVRAAFKLIDMEFASVQEETIEGIDHPFARAILKWRKANKSLSTYILPLWPESDHCVLMPDGLIHPVLLPNRVRTWRSSSELPNSQNYPKHGDGREVRAQIEAPLEHVIVAFDFGQIQARNVAQESDDEALVKSMWERHDIHADWRDRIFELHPRWAKPSLKKVLASKDLLKAHRQVAKGFVFARFFGAGGPRVAQHLGVPDPIGYQLVEEFNAKFPGIARWHEHLHAFYAEHGYVTGLTGFRRHAPVAHTEIINTPIQSDEAMIMFDAMIRLAETREPHFAPNLEIHDSLEFIWPKAKLDEYAEYVIGEMLNCSLPWAHKVPIVVEMSVGKTWDKMEACGEYESDIWRAGSYKRHE